MKEWYYSGLQGLCVSLSRHSSAFDGSASASALLARELFNDDSRFGSASNVSRTWRLSPARRARMFEERWASMGRSVRASDDVRAVLACVARLRASEESFLLREALCDAADATSIVKDEILPAMESGFTTERYPDYAIRAFSDDVRSLVAAFNRFDEDAAGTLLVRLVSAAVYGPLHTLALSSGRARTDLAVGTQGSSGDAFESQGVVLMQVEDPSVARVRYVRTVGSDTAVFIGRSARMERYEEAASDLSDVLGGKKRALFHLTESFRRVSACHGVLVETGGRWMYYDLGSTNGTAAGDEDSMVDVNPAVMVKPGDFLWLGASASEAKGVAESGRGALLKVAEHVRSFGAEENGGGHGLCG